MLYTRVTFNNWGVYYKKNQFNFSLEPNSKRVIIPVGGRSGEGKTTFLNGVKTVLFGSNADCVNKRNYKQFINSMLNNKSRLEGDYKIYIELEMELLNNKQVVLKREWNIIEDTNINEVLTITVDGQTLPTLEDSQDKKQFLQTIMPLETSQFFLFDGENVQDIANDDNYDKQIENAMMDTLNISTYVHVSDSLEKYIKKVSKDLNKGVARSDLSSLSSEIYRFCEESEKLERALAVFNRELSLLDEDALKINSHLYGFDSSSHDKRENLVYELDQKIQEKQVLRNKIIQQIGSTLATATLENALLQIKEQFLTEETYMENLLKDNKTESAFNAILDQLNNSIIDPELTPNQKEVIIDLQTNIWREQIGSRINKIDLIHYNAISQVEHEYFKETINNALTEVKESDVFTEEFSYCYKRVIEEIEELQVQLNNMPTRNEIMSSEAKLMDINLRRNNLNNEIQSITMRLGSIESQSNDLKLKREQMTAELNINIEIELKIKKALEVQEVLFEYVKVLKKKKSEDVSRYQSEMFKKLHRKKNYAQNFNFDPHTFKASFENDLNQFVYKDNLSQSEKQIYAISLLWALQMASKQKYPVIIDTPLGRLDCEHKTNMLEHYFPFAGPQVIILSNEEEISVARRGMMAPYIAHEYLLKIYPEDHHQVHILEDYFK